MIKRALVALVALLLLAASAQAVQVPAFNPLFSDSVRVGGSSNVWIRIMSTDSTVYITTTADGTGLIVTDGTDSVYLTTSNGIFDTVTTDIIVGRTSTDSMTIVMRPDQNDTCSYYYYDRADSSFHFKPCGKADFALDAHPDDSLIWQWDVWDMSSADSAARWIVLLDTLVFPSGATILGTGYTIDSAWNDTVISYYSTSADLSSPTLIDTTFMTSTSGRDVSPVNSAPGVDDYIFWRIPNAPKNSRWFHFFILYKKP